MRNRAKCKLCGDIIESFHEFDHVICKCDQIAISGGQVKYECAARSFDNFLRIDDEGNQIVPSVVVDVKTAKIISDHIAVYQAKKIPDEVALGPVMSQGATKQNLIDSLDSQIKTFKRIFELHPDMQYQYVSQADFVSSLELILDCLRSGCIDRN